MQRLRPLDESFLHLETDRCQMHIGAIAVFEGPPPPYDDVLAMVERKLHRIPRYRQRVRFVPLALGAPRWVDDPHFNLGYHLRHTALPGPGSPEQLENLVGRVMSQRLDRDRPLWEMWVVEGLADGCWALLYKLHHAMVDGISGTDLLIVLLDRERDARPGPPPRWAPEPQPGTAGLLGQSALERATGPYRALRAAATAARAPEQLASRLLETGRGLADMSGLLRRSPSTSLNGPIGPHRSWTWARARLSDVKVVRRELGGTVNDVLLCMVANGFRELLRHRGEASEVRVVRTMVPVSVRGENERETWDNRVSAVFAELPVDIADPVARLDAVRRQMEGLKESSEARAAQALTALSGFVPPMLLALSERVAVHVPQHQVNTVTTNVPGPQFPLYALGRRMLEAFPYVPLNGHVRVGVAIFSYDGAINVGITGDFDTARDIGVLAHGIESGLAELLEAAGAAEAPPPRPGGRPAHVTAPSGRPPA